MRHKLCWWDLRRAPRIVVVVVVTCVLVPISGWAESEVSACGQVVTGAAFLAADLDCSNAEFGSSAVVLNRAELDLRGFAIIGPVSTSSSTIRCKRRCQVFSSLPGATITAQGTASFSSAAVAHEGFRRRFLIRVTDVTIPRGRIFSPEGRVRLERVVFPEPPMDFKLSRWAVVRGGRGVEIIDGTFVNHDGTVVSVGLTTAARAARVKLDRVSITGTTALSVTPGTTSMVFAGRLRVRDSTISQSALTCFGYNTFLKKAVFVRTQIDACSEYGVWASRVRLKESSITNCGLYGTFASNVALSKNSTASGSGTDSECGVTLTCADILAVSATLHSASTCETSHDSTSGFPGTSLGVCALD